MTKQLILLVSPGTAAPDNRKSARTGIKRTVAEQFPGWELREAFTSIINEALEKAEAESVRRLIVQPLHLMHGREYAKVVCALRERGRYFAQVVLGEPLLSSDADFAAVLLAVIRRTAEFDDGRTLQQKLGTIDGITDSLESNDLKSALAAKAGKVLNDRVNELAVKVTENTAKLNGLSFTVLTQAEYDALPVKDAATLYFIYTN